jgi:hypothetical protein
MSFSTYTEWPPTVEDLKGFLKIQDSDNVDDLVVMEYAVRAADFVESYCQRRFNKETRTYIIDGPGGNKIRLPDWPIGTITSIKYNDAAPRDWSGDAISSDLYMVPYSGAPDERQDHILIISGDWYQGPQCYQVVADTGYANPPADLYQACIEVAAFLYNASRHGRLGVSSQSTDGGTTGYDLETTIPRQTRELLARYRNLEV